MAEHPFYIRQTADQEHVATPEARNRWIKDAWEEACEQGAKHGRVSLREKPVMMLLVEGWAEVPEDEGHQRWALQ